MEKIETLLPINRDQRDKTLLCNRYYRNPFNPEMRIDFTIPDKQVVTLRVYNILGKLVTGLIHEEKDAGSYSVTFDASNLSSGIYVYRLETTDFIGLRKMTILK